MHKIYCQLKGFNFLEFESCGFIPFSDHLQGDIPSGDGYGPNICFAGIGFGRGGYPSGDGGLTDFMIWFEDPNA
jgi:hypothetical protein